MVSRINPLISKTEHKNLNDAMWGVINPFNLIKICYRYCHVTRKKWGSLDPFSQTLIDQRINHYIIPTFTGYYNFSFIQRRLIKLELKYTFVKILTKKENKELYFNNGKVEEKILEGSRFEKDFQEILPIRTENLFIAINRIKATVLPVEQSAKKKRCTPFFEVNEKLQVFFKELKDVNPEELKKKLKDQETIYLIYALMVQAFTQDLKERFECLKQAFHEKTTPASIVSTLLQFNDLIIEILNQNAMNTAEDEMLPAFVAVCSLLNHPLSWEIADALDFYCYKMEYLKEVERAAGPKKKTKAEEDAEYREEKGLRLAQCFKAYVKVIMTMEPKQLEKEFKEIQSRKE